MKTATPEQLKQLEEIAGKLGCSVQDLLAKNDDPAVIIESYLKKNLKILNE